MTDHTFAYTKTKWKYPGGCLQQDIALVLERWTDGQVHLLRARDLDGSVIPPGWLDDMLREWVQTHQHELTAACFAQMEASLDEFAEQVDDYMTAAL